MTWNIISRLSLLHRRGAFEALLMLASGCWVIFNVEFADPTPYTWILEALMAIGAAVMASIVYWAVGVLWFGLQVLWALLKIIIHVLRGKLGKVGST